MAPSPAPAAVAKFELPETLPDSDPRKRAYLASLAEMVHKYPESIVPGTALHERIARMNQRCIATADPIAASPDKPMLIAEICVAQMKQEAAALGPAPVAPPAAQPGPAAPGQRKAAPKAAADPSLQDRIDELEDALRREELQRDLDDFHRHMKDFHDQGERANRLPPIKPPPPLPVVPPISPSPGGAGR